MISKVTPNFENKIMNSVAIYQVKQKYYQGIILDFRIFSYGYKHQMLCRKETLEVGIIFSRKYLNTRTQTHVCYFC